MTRTDTAPALFLGYANVDIVARVPALPGDGDRVTAECIASSFGGMAANAACAAARAGAHAYFFGGVADDAFGRLVVDDLRARGVETRYMKKDAPTTSKALILVAPGGERAIVSEPVMYDGEPLRRFLERVRGAPGLLYTDGYHLVRAHAELARARSLGFRIYCDLDGAPDTSPPSEVWSALAHVDIAQWNPTLARALTGKRDLEAADAELARLVPVVLRTAGAEPVAVSDDHGNRYEVPIPPVDVVTDTTGAGDSFAGTVIAALLAGADIRSAVARGIASATAIVQLSGARPPLGDDGKTPP